MQAHHIEFLELLNGQVQYVVSHWQRWYRRGQADIERLVEDLVTVAVGGPMRRTTAARSSCSRNPEHWQANSMFRIDR